MFFNVIKILRYNLKINNFVSKVYKNTFYLDLHRENNET